MVSEEQIQRWADEDEAGYDIEELKRRGAVVPDEGQNGLREPLRQPRLTRTTLVVIMAA